MAFVSFVTEITMTKSLGKAIHTTKDPPLAKSKRVVASGKAGGSKSKKQKCTAIVKVESKVVPMSQRLRTRGRNTLSKPTTSSTPMDVDEDNADSGSGNIVSLTRQGSDLPTGMAVGGSGSTKNRHAFHLEEIVDDPEDVRMAFMKRYEENHALSRLVIGNIRNSRSVR